MKTPENRLQRRTFMAAALCTPAIAAVALIGRSRPAPAPVAAAPADEPPVPAAEQGGYHETEHIRQYYASASF
ncbi:formate dehydrogenase [Caldimonas tepidiphila]|uniref:formate dehydrogenase n=1 Tax=Caldimonas tepidiphila TaxID=2315841 RepID=UPI000E5C186C|nr:formate dehydrogenase [Caldimonas tepidiphila]